MNDSIVESYVKQLVDKGLVKFGWNEDVTEYKYVKYFESGVYLAIQCQYINNNKVFSKQIEVRRDDILQYIRDNKLNDLGI